MAEKSLTEAHWKSITKGKTLTGEADVLKALAQWTRTEKAKPDAAGLAQQRDALGALDKARAAFEKANTKLIRAEKTLVGLMADMESATERCRKALEQQAQELDKAQAKASASDEDDEAPDILTTRMTPLLRQVRQGAEMHTKLVLSGRELVVMLSRKAISPARKALMVEMLEQKSSVKVIDGTCILENKFVTFVLNNPAGGLAKRISAALLKQTGMRVPVRVRGPNGDVDDADEGDDDQPADQGDKAAKSDAPKTAAPEPQAEELATRLKTLMPALQKALVAKHPASDALKRGASEVGALHKQPRWNAATKLLQALEAQLKSASSSASAPTPGDSPGPEGTKKSAPSGAQAGRFVHHARSRILWQKVRQKIQTDLSTLEQAILAYCKSQPDLEDAAAKVRKLDTILKELDESLSDALDMALNAPDDRARLALHEKSREVLAGYIQFANTDPLLSGIDKNPFVPLKTREFLVNSLQTLDKSLA